MEYWNITHFLDNRVNQSSKFRTRHWVEINDSAHRIYSTKTQIKFKTTKISSSLWDYSDACILKTEYSLIEQSDK